WDLLALKPSLPVVRHGARETLSALAAAGLQRVRGFLTNSRGAGVGGGANAEELFARGASGRIAFALAWAALSLSGCVHSPAAGSAQELSQVRDELRRLRADREEDRRAIRVLEARLAASIQGQRGITQGEPEGSGSVHPSIPKDLAVVRLEPASAPALETEED